MEAVYLPEQDMHPRIRMARLYDTEQFGITGATPVRVVNCFELSTFLCDGGVIYINGQAQRIHSGTCAFPSPATDSAAARPFAAARYSSSSAPRSCGIRTSLSAPSPGTFPAAAYRRRCSGR
ncbi:MAG: hypothetical protein V8S87_04660 [Oscillospiraceae bacterium]